jgi:hypothetical protein
VASHVKDVAPENGSTTSRHAERNDVVDALRALQSIGDLAASEMAQALDRMVLTELSTSNDHSGPRIMMRSSNVRYSADPDVGQPYRRAYGRTQIVPYGRSRGGHGTRQAGHPSGDLRACRHR